MESSGFAVAIMAAGKGTRLKSKRPKVLHEVGGRALLLHVISAAETVAAPREIFCIIGHEADRVRAAVAPTGVEFVLQAEQRGTGHALQVLKAAFDLSGKQIPKHLLVLSGDVPLIRSETLSALTQFHLSQRAAMTILTALSADPTGYGRVLRRTRVRRGHGDRRAKSRSRRSSWRIARDQSGIYASRPRRCSASSDELSTENAHGEFYLTDVAGLLSQTGERVVAIEAAERRRSAGREHLAEMMHPGRHHARRTARRLMAQE